jgi:hypothetical protein
MSMLCVLEKPLLVLWGMARSDGAGEAERIRWPAGKKGEP